MSCAWSLVCALCGEGWLRATGYVREAVSYLHILANEQLLLKEPVGRETENTCPIASFYSTAGQDWQPGHTHTHTDANLNIASLFVLLLLCLSFSALKKQNPCPSEEFKSEGLVISLVSTECFVFSSSKDIAVMESCRRFENDTTSSALLHASSVWICYSFVCVVLSATKTWPWFIPKDSCEIFRDLNKGKKTNVIFCWCRDFKCFWMHFIASSMLRSQKIVEGRTQWGFCRLDLKISFIIFTQ